MTQPTTKAPFWHQANDQTAMLLLPVEEPRADGISKLSTTVLGYVSAVGTIDPLYQAFAFTGLTNDAFPVRSRHHIDQAKADVMQFLKEMNRWPIAENEVVAGSA